MLKTEGVISTRSDSASGSHSSKHDRGSQHCPGLGAGKPGNVKLKMVFVYFPFLSRMILASFLTVIESMDLLTKALLPIAIPGWRNTAVFAVLLMSFRTTKLVRLSSLLSLVRTPFWRVVILVLGIPFIMVCHLVNSVLRITWKLRLQSNGVSVATAGIDESTFADEKEFRRIVDRIGNSGARTTGSKRHNDYIDWVEQELRRIPGLSIRSDEYDILRWQTVDGASLKDAGKLFLGIGKQSRDIPIAGVVPFSLATSGQSGKMIYLPRDVPITETKVKGRVLLRDFPAHAIPYSLVFLPSYSKTADLNFDLLSNYDRPGLADGPLKEDLIAAGKSGAVGMIIMFDVVREQVESYFEPHQGVHYKLPATFVGVDEAMILKAEAVKGATVTLVVDAEISTATTRNVFATLPGQIKERVIFQTHTDGNTFVQENGAAAVLTLAQYYAKQPLSSRKRSIEFAFNTAHLHISREGTARHAEQLNATYDDGTLAILIPVEHMGTREIEAVARTGAKPGRELRFSGRGEMMFWCCGPSPAVVKAVQEAVARRKLDRVLVTRGTSMPDLSQVPTFSSFGGIGTYYHNLLLPTTSLISGPWSLWAPYFGSDAVDISRLRLQTLAIGDIYLAMQNVPRNTIAAGYLDFRDRRANGAKVPDSLIPLELA